uniref:GDP-fucose protein O-fucosyltransferase 2 n=1 Tax=Trichuris muris TaxID=70415 RepID=A0A5S6QGC2_TRIMR
MVWKSRLAVLSTFTAILYSSFSYAGDPTISVVDPHKYSLAKERRYLLYEVNPGEGFNLRRDVYMRIAEVVRHLRKRGHNFILVLPPWGASIHWQSSELGFQEKIPWKLWFDLSSLNKFVPVIELDQFLQETGSTAVDTLFFLQQFSEGWTHWSEKYEHRPCIKHYYYEETPGHWKFWFWGYDDIYARNVSCVSFQGYSRTAVQLVLSTDPKNIRSVMIDRAEVMLHDHFGNKEYWDCRKSMRYSPELRAVADEYRAKELNSNDISDRTSIHEDWTKMKVHPGQAKGGPYMAVHLRRRDFVAHRRNQTPSIQGAIDQIAIKAKENSLDVVFIATDGNKEEIRSLFDGLIALGLVPKRFVPNRETLRKFMDGGISIIDQWICAHARYFLGSSESTFTLRIFDDREILGFDSSTTFNSFCGVDELECEQPARWKLVQ